LINILSKYRKDWPEFNAAKSKVVPPSNAKSPKLEILKLPPAEYPASRVTALVIVN
jgi:hypothetical protein